MARDTEKRLRCCEMCQHTKTQTTGKLGQMKTPTLPHAPLDDIAFDFIGPLPLINGYNYLLTCTCCLTGFTRLIPCNTKDNTEQIAKRFFASWLGIFGAPRSIIGDRNKIWTSTFWKHLMKRLSVSLQLTTAYHPEADGRSKRTNKTVAQVLCTFTTKRQTRWLDALPAAEKREAVGNGSWGLGDVGR